MSIADQSACPAQDPSAPVETWLLDGIVDSKARFLAGGKRELKEFFGYFERWPVCQPPITVPRQ